MEIETEDAFRSAVPPRRRARGAGWIRGKAPPHPPCPSTDRCFSQVYACRCHLFSVAAATKPFSAAVHLPRPPRPSRRPAVSDGADRDAQRGSGAGARLSAREPSYRNRRPDAAGEVRMTSGVLLAFPRSRLDPGRAERAATCGAETHLFGHGGA
eukprot:349682-Chlamydomonas_euryale.AAC.17